MAEYDDAEYLQLSGIQHFAFCRRQWALIHIEQQWSENLLTFYGRDLHERVDDPTIVEKRGNVITSRSVPVVSHNLKLYGVADVVELIQHTQGDITLAGYPGRWRAYPVEYKLGRPKPTNIDAVQLCAQAICLEEMLNTTIATAYMFYGRPRRRVEIPLVDELRQEVFDLVNEMHKLFASGQTPVATRTAACRSCSLVDLCVPQLNEGKKVEMYVRSVLAL